MTNNFIRDFLVNSDETGRFIVVSKRTGKRYFVEAVGTYGEEWGSVDPASGKLMNKKGWKKHTGSIDACDSMIEEDKGFDKIHSLKPGESPLLYIEKLDSQYKDK